MKKSLLEKILSALSNNIPAKGLSNYLYQQIQQLTSQKDIEAFQLIYKNESRILSQHLNSN
ncbi:hypothetical protein DXB51_18945 [Bacillus cereus]|nr:hypothetical protein DXB51_18945 [Bacillus cereus]RSC66261.1 hypothetical protein EGS86_00075 [Bacillus sp. (in: firmicutes)]